MTLRAMLQVLMGYVGARFLGAGLGVLSQIVMARLLPQADVGTVLMAMSAAAFISLFAIGGHAMLAGTELPKLMAIGAARRIQAFHAAAMRDSVLAMLGIAALIIVAVLFLPFEHNISMALAFGLAGAVAGGLLRYNSIVANSLRRFALSYVPDFIIRPVLMLAALAMLWGVSTAMGAASVLVCYIVVGLVVAFGQALILKRDALHPAHLSLAVPRYARALRKRVIALTLVSAVTLAFADIVTMVAGLILPPDQVAIVGIAVRLAAVGGFVLQAAQLFVLPDFTAALTRNDQTSANALLWKSNVLTLAVVAAGLIATLLLGRWALGLFGDSYEAGFSLLVLFMIGQSVRALGGMNQNLLSVERHQLRLAGACAIALVCLVLLSILLVGSFGPVGIGYAVVATEIIWLVVLAAQAQSLCGRRADVLWLLLDERAKAGGQ